jgi:8-oxo-dGTP pyrophosphatase MutT (NUDIX family)
MQAKMPTLYCSGCGHALPQLPPVTCNVCGTAHWRDAKPCASSLVTWHGRLLLVQRANQPWRGHWDTPGGFCGPDEHPMVTAEREVLEETGLAVRITGCSACGWTNMGPATTKPIARRR